MDYFAFRRLSLGNYGTFRPHAQSFVIFVRIKGGITFVPCSWMHAVEDCIVSRYQMYMQVYFHPAAGWKSLNHWNALPLATTQNWTIKTLATFWSLSSREHGHWRLLTSRWWRIEHILLTGYCKKMPSWSDWSDRYQPTSVYQRHLTVQTMAPKSNAWNKS